MSDIYKKLLNAVLYENAALITKFCTEDKTLDLTQDGGAVFILAIESGNIEITQKLIEYYHANHDNQWQKTLDGIIDVATEDVKISVDMQHILSEYLKLGIDVATDCQNLSYEMPQLGSYQFDNNKLQSSAPLIEEYTEFEGTDDTSAVTSFRDGVEVTMTGESLFKTAEESELAD